MKNHKKEQEQSSKINLEKVESQNLESFQQTDSLPPLVQLPYESIKNDYDCGVHMSDEFLELIEQLRVHDDDYFPEKQEQSSILVELKRQISFSLKNILIGIFIYVILFFCLTCLIDFLIGFVFPYFYFATNSMTYCGPCFSYEPLFSYKSFLLSEEEK